MIEEVVRLQDQVVWVIRNQVREIEKTRAPISKPAPNYRYPHNISRHAIHVSETLDAAIIRTMNRILIEHKGFMACKQVTSLSNTSKHIHRRLLFPEHLLQSLQHRSASTEERPINEIQLALNMVVQYDSGMSVEIQHVILQLEFWLRLLVGSRQVLDILGSRDPYNGHYLFAMVLPT